MIDSSLCSLRLGFTGFILLKIGKMCNHLQPHKNLFVLGSWKKDLEFHQSPVDRQC